jgi:tetratricopeptide (TPR) repeat protein
MKTFYVRPCSCWKTWKKAGVETMKNIGFIVLSILMLAGLSAIAFQMTAPSPLGSADRQTFERANQLYMAGKYAAATNLYEQLVDKGVTNPDLFFNLANAYSQTGNSEQAAEYYARAAELAPRDGAITSRLGITSSPFPMRIPLTTNETAMGALMLTCLLAILLVGKRHRLFSKQAA